MSHTPFLHTLQKRNLHPPDAWQWIPDLIAYDANPAHLLLSTSYYMIQLFSSTRITENLPVTISPSSQGYNPAYWVAGRNAQTGSHILKAAVYNSSKSVLFSVDFEGLGPGAQGELTWLTAEKNASCTLEGGNVVQTHKKTVVADGQGVLEFELPTFSVAVLEVGAGCAGEGRRYVDEGARKGWKGWGD